MSGETGAAEEPQGPKLRPKHGDSWGHRALGDSWGHRALGDSWGHRAAATAAQPQMGGTAGTAGTENHEPLGDVRVWDSASG